MKTLGPVNYSQQITVLYYVNSGLFFCIISSDDLVSDPSIRVRSPVVIDISCSIFLKHFSHVASASSKSQGRNVKLPQSMFVAEIV